MSNQGQERHHRRRSTQIPPSPTAAHSIHTRLPRLFTGYSPAAVKATKENPSSNLEEDPPSEEDALSSDEDTESLNRTKYRHSTSSSFLAPATTREAYSRAMHAHHTTTSQSPSNTIQAAGKRPLIPPVPDPTTTTPPPQSSYARTMHAFTLNQLNHMNNTGSHNPNNNKKILPAPQPTKPTAHRLSKTTSIPIRLPPAQTQSTALRDEQPLGPSNTPEPAAGGPTTAPVAPSSAPAANLSLSLTEMQAQGRELEARFEALMAGTLRAELCGGMGDAQVRDWARVGMGV